jgi:hypothetical protein
MSKRIAILVEGATERILSPVIRDFLGSRLEQMPKIDTVPCHGRIPKYDELKRRVDNLLSGRDAADAVIALTDVYTGTNDFLNAPDAKNKMRQWVGSNPRFYPHVALHDFEAWLFPYWPDIQSLAGSNRAIPSRNPESVNHNRPPAEVLKQVFLTGSHKKAYVKPRDAARILRGKDITVAAYACPELKEFLNTILVICGAATL